MAFVFNPRTGGYTLAMEESPIQAPVAETPATAGISSVVSSEQLNPLTGKPYNWTDQADYGDVYAYVNSPQWGFYGVPSGDEPAFDGVWDLQTNEAIKAIAQPGMTFGYQDDGRMQSNVVKDASGNVVYRTDPTYHTPQNFFKDTLLPMAAFAIGAPMLGSAAGIPIPAGTPTLAGLFGGSGAAAQGGASAADIAAMGDVGMGAYGAPIPYTSEFSGLGSLAGQSVSAAPTQNAVQSALAELTQTSAPAVAEQGGVQAALNELVGQTQLPVGTFTSPGVQTALNELVQMSPLPVTGVSANGVASLPAAPGTSSAFDKFKTWAAANPLQAIQAGSLIAGKLLGKDTSSGGIGSLTDQSGITANKPAAFKREYVAPPAGYRPGIDPEHKYFK